MHQHGFCEQYLSQFSEYIDGELSADFCERLEAHLSHCDNCRIVLNTLRKTIDLYQNASPQEELPEKVRSRLYARLKLDEGPQHG